ncbi:MAG: FkbM family methyltransferase [Pirellulales bacterium]
MPIASSRSWLRRSGGRLLWLTRSSLRRFAGGKKPAVVPDVFGHKLHQNPDDVAINFSRLCGLPLQRFPYGELGLIHESVKPGDRVIDLGANIGFYTLLFAQCVGPQGCVYAFEPGPKSFEILSRNVRENEYGNVILEPLAVTNKTGPLKLLVCRSGESDNRIADTGVFAGDRDCVELQGAALDDYFAKIPGGIDFIKMDIQGAEYLALQGMTKLLARSPNVRLIVEFCPAAFDKTISTAEYLRYLRGLGFRVFDLPEDRPRYEATDDQLLAAYPPGKMTNLVLER